MRIFEIVEKIICFIIDRPYLPKEFREKARGPLLLHISDTPAQIFPFLSKLIKEINPQYIVHTGDIVDNIKLETNINELDVYKKELEKIINIIETNSKAKIYYALGNHDHEASLRELTKNEYILKKNIIRIEGCSIYVSHYYEENKVETDFFLYGHSFLPNFRDGKQIGLNGILAANIIDLNSKEIFQVNYPMATNRWRKMEQGRVGL